MFPSSLLPRVAAKPAIESGRPVSSLQPTLLLATALTAYAQNGEVALRAPLHTYQLSIVAMRTARPTCGRSKMCVRVRSAVIETTIRGRSFLTALCGRLCRGLARVRRRTKWGNGRQDVGLFLVALGLLLFAIAFGHLHSLGVSGSRPGLHSRAFPRETYTAAATVPSESHIAVDASIRGERTVLFLISPRRLLPPTAVETHGASNGVRTLSGDNGAPIAATREELRARSARSLM